MNKKDDEKHLDIPARTAKLQECALPAIRYVAIFRTAVRLSRSTVAASCGIDQASGSRQSTEQPESDRCKKSGEAISSHGVFGSPPRDRVALPGAMPAACRAVRRAGLDGARRLP